MLRHTLLGLVLIVVATSSSFGQDWARKMFDDTSHDFGSVARGAKSEFRFKFKNLYEEDLHVSGVRTSCNCTTPELTKHDLKTYETGEVVAKFNTGTYLGYHSATLTVTFDKPFFAEVQLQISGNIRGEVVVTPSFVDLGNVDFKGVADRVVSVTHQGREDWKIVDVRSANTNFEVEVKEKARTSSQVTYDLHVQLKNDAPVGYIKDQLVLITNDPKAPQFPIDVEGNVIPEITVSPSSLSLGKLVPGQKATQLLVVVGKKPFKVLDVKCDNDAFKFQTPTSDVSQKVFRIPVTFTAGDTPGAIAQKIRIETDMGQSAAPEIIAHAQIMPAQKQ